MPDIEQAKLQICEIGRRIYARQFAAGNDGNISVRISEQEILCTPTLISKGFISPTDLCTVDSAGNQLSGERRVTSEIAMHLKIYECDPSARAVVHCHPPHATAFAISSQALPTGILPEAEVFLGAVPVAAYETPGTKEFAECVAPHVSGHNVVILKNHGTVSWAGELERAYWLTETLDAYCRVLLLASQAGPIDRLPPEKLQTILAARPKFGMDPDPRAESGDLYVNPRFGNKG